MDIVQTVRTALQQTLGNYLDELARECGVVVRQRKFSGQTLLHLLVITLLHQPDATWWDFVITATQLGLHVSQTAIQKRFAAGEPLVDFLRQALQRALQQTVASQPAAAALLQRFTAVFVGDSTTITLPDELADRFAGCGGTHGSGAAALKIQVLWDLKTGRLEQLLLEAGRASDAKSPIAVEQAEPGTLLVYDLGYFSVARFAALDRQQTQFLSRLQPGTAVFDAAGDAVDLVDYLRRQHTDLVDVAIQLGADERLACRLLAVRVPEEIANRRRQQAYQKARDHGRTPSAAYLELLGWTLLVTNAAVEQLTWKAVVVLYRARWQIELLFKLWKSHNGLARSRSGASALECLAVFYAKLLGVVLQHWLLLATAWPLPRRSLRQAARVLREHVKPLLLALPHPAQLEQALRDLQQLLEKLAQVKDRHKNPGHAQLLDDPELLDWLA